VSNIETKDGNTGVSNSASSSLFEVDVVFLSNANRKRGFKGKEQEIDWHTKHFDNPEVGIPWPKDWLVPELKATARVAVRLITVTYKLTIASWGGFIPLLNESVRLLAELKFQHKGEKTPLRDQMFVMLMF